MAQPQIDISQLNDDLRNRLLNENATIEVLLTADRAITTEDIEISSGTDIGKKPFLTPDSAGTTVTLTLDDIGNVGDIINFSGNVRKPSAVLQIDEGTASIVNLTTVDFNAFSVSASQLCVLRKLAANTYRIDGSFTEIEVDVTPPVLQTAAVQNSNPSELVLTYDENIDTLSVPANGDFSVNDGAANAVTGVAIDVTNVVLTLTNPIDNGDTVTVSYTAGANPIQDTAGNDAPNLVSQAVTNNVAASAVYTISNAANPSPETTGSDTGFNAITNVTINGTASSPTPTNGSEVVVIQVNTSASSHFKFDTTGITNGDNVTITYDLYIEGSGSGNVFARLNASQDDWDSTAQQNIGSGSRGTWVPVSLTANATADNPLVQVQASGSASGITNYYVDNIVITIN